VNAYARFAAALTSVVLGLQVVHGATESRHAPTLSAGSLDSLLRTRVVEPLRNRDLGWDLFSRAGPRWDADALRAVADDARPAPDGWISFRVEAPSMRRPGAYEQVWTGRLHEASGRVELAHPQASGQALQWRPLADVVKDGAFETMRYPSPQ
jgi:hypothetical protein